jgi:hypothetical protein
MLFKEIIPTYSESYMKNINKNADYWLLKQVEHIVITRLLWINAVFR